MSPPMVVDEVMVLCCEGLALVLVVAFLFFFFFFFSCPVSSGWGPEGAPRMA